MAAESLLQATVFWQNCKDARDAYEQYCDENTEPLFHAGDSVKNQLLSYYYDKHVKLLGSQSLSFEDFCRSRQEYYECQQLNCEMDGSPEPSPRSTYQELMYDDERNHFERCYDYARDVYGGDDLLYHSEPTWWLKGPELLYGPVQPEIDLEPAPRPCRARASLRAAHGGRRL